MTQQKHTGSRTDVPKPQTQSDKFKAAARELECDENEARWDERLKKVVKAKPSMPTAPDETVS